MPLRLHDAFIVPLYCGEIGIPMFGMEMLRRLGKVDGELATRVAAQAEVYRGNGARVGAQIVEIERVLRAAQLAVPARPNTFDDYLHWSDNVAKIVADHTGPEAPAGVVAALARVLGETVRGIAVLIDVLYLRAVAPASEALRVFDEQASQLLADAVRRLDAMSTFSTLPPIVRPEAERLASFARMTLALDPAKLDVREAGLKLVFGELAEHVRALTAAIAGAGTN